LVQDIDGIEAECMQLSIYLSGLECGDHGDGDGGGKKGVMATLGMEARSQSRSRRAKKELLGLKTGTSMSSIFLNSMSSMCGFTVSLIARKVMSSLV
jgi:hypothetical protein